MAAKNTIYIVDDDGAMRKSLALLLQGEGFDVKTYSSAQTFIERESPPLTGCLLLDVRMPGIDGFELQNILQLRGIHLSIIMITGHADVPMAVRAMKLGAKDFIEKPFRAQTLLDRLHKILSEETPKKQFHSQPEKLAQLESLTRRERQVFKLLAQGKMNKHIAAELCISIRTVETHRANIMEKLKVRSLADIVRLAILETL
ncbi:response regulator transcription factor [Nitrosococcus oceani]|uniref:Two component transcriptional regulator, LuxR family n=2 Tax=Nitrosococcus oceani TaxID=1229 RepID=Q3JAH3_NITOC|nr:response regulator [Nitrosococcus oceani]KFI19387.1 LuxR family transcriptional regulator [Nitrosococcus oceani C-27]ABA58173.1 two component transcriptional regulator, LuxR family [Nitrosococcus oceani ATCC 19707]EDZ67080.1 response regulator receiver domain protein [Nitrosococcus oceani AFC27]KFI22669.1 LuxR family transcriptional regulator [Nitrosococcus oceani]GEM20393.1 DNA-binding response regulator [Nitrosococcus oceani]